MSLAVVFSRGLNGTSAPPVVVEVHLANGLPAFNIVGLPDTGVKESRDRVRAAVLQSGFEFPAKKITVNLAPADLPKESGRFDLPIAIGLLMASGQLRLSADARPFECAGELGLTGEVRPIRGAVAMAIAAAAENHDFILPAQNAAQASLTRKGTVYGVCSLAETVAHLNGSLPLAPATAPVFTAEAVADKGSFPDMADVRGQHTARTALEIAAAGGHSLLMCGPPGTGKSMLAARLPGILPPPDEEERLAIWAVQSLLSASETAAFSVTRPFRAPHHSASAAALVGGGTDPRPGEISLAHNGVLFLDELPEFDRKVLEVLREPLENGEIHISRAARRAVFPARFQLVAAMNPCPCGYLGHPRKACRCTPDAVARYRQKISGPLLDRIDLCIDVPALESADLISAPPGESSAVVRERVLHTRRLQIERQGKSNALLSSAELDTKACIQPEAASLLAQSLEKLSLSARSYHRLLRIARTLADMAGTQEVLPVHVMQAVSFRRSLQNG